MAIELDAASGLTLPDDGPGNRGRFAAVFQGVWQKIPGEDRDRILVYWRKSRGAPLIDLVSRFKLPGENDKYGDVIRFNAEAADWMPEDKLAGLIAHELAHVWHYGNPESESSKKTGRVPIEVLTGIKEREADELATAWGYDMTGLREWGNANLDKFREFGCIFLKGAKF